MMFREENLINTGLGHTILHSKRQEGRCTMPIKISNELPAYRTLTDENIFVMTENRATTQDIRPLRIAIVNLMPTKIDTETQLLRLLGNTSLQVETELVKMASHVSKNTSAIAIALSMSKKGVENLTRRIVSLFTSNSIPFERSNPSVL